MESLMLSTGMRTTEERICLEMGLVTVLILYLSSSAEESYKHQIMFLFLKSKLKPGALH
jgi:hypothetical protein